MHIPAPAPGTVPISATLANIIAELYGWTDYRNANNNDLLNLRTVGARTFYLNGQKVSGYGIQQTPATATADPLAWNFTARDFQGKPSVLIGGLAIDPDTYTITRTVAPLAFINPSFEAGIYSGWGAGTTTGVTTVNPDAGTYCAVISSPGGYIYQVSATGLTPGTVYPVTVRMRGDAGGTATGTLQLSNSGGLVSQNSGTLTASWQTVTKSFAADASGTITVALVRSSSGAGAIYFDTVAGVTLTNAGFGLGNLSGWSASDFGTTSVNPHTSALCAFLAGGGYLFQPLSGLTLGATYPVTIWYRGDAGSLAKIAIEVHDGSPGAANQSQSPWMPVSPIWQSLTWDYVANATGVIGVALIHDSGAGPASFDDSDILGGYQPSTMTINFLPGYEPYSTERVSVLGNLSL